MVRLALLVTVLCSVSVHAADPALPPADRNTPKGSLQLLGKALSSGDMDQFKSSIRTTDDSEQKLAEVGGKFLMAAEKLRLAVTKKIGEEAGHKILDHIQGPSRLGEHISRDLPKAQEKIDGDRATITFTEENGMSTVVPMEKSDGKWVVSVSTMLGERTGGEIEMLTMVLPMGTAAIEKTAGEVHAGKYSTLEEVQQAIQRNIGGATSLPSTLPVPK